MKDLTPHYKERLGRCIVFLLKPLVRILMRSGIGFSDFAEWAKFAYVDVAEKEFGIENKSQSTSRISILTGLHRKEAARIRKAIEDGQVSERGSSANRAERVINAWLRNSKFIDSDNLPIDLPFTTSDPAQPSFESLVKCHSGDIHSATLLDELTRIGAVQTMDNGFLHLKQTGYIPAVDSLESLDIMGQSAHDLFNTLSHNVNPEETDKHFQRTVAYRHLSEDTLKEFKQYSEQENEKLLLKLNKWLAQRDMSTAEQKLASCQYRAGVGIYYFEELSSKTNQD